MTPTERALLAAIVAVPDDDTARFVYADWLEEDGRPERAEFIRLQVRSKAILDDPAREEEWGHVRAEARRLDPDFNDARNGELPVLPGVRWSDFDRGFVKSALVRATADPAAFDAACDLLPLTSARMLLGAEIDPTPFLTTRVAGRLRTLSLDIFSGDGRYGGAADEASNARRMAWIARFPWPRKLERLYLERAPHDGRARQALEPLLRKVRRPKVYINVTEALAPAPKPRQPRRRTP